MFGLRKGGKREIKKIERILKNLDDNYECVFDYCHSDERQNIIIDEKNNEKRCRFCGKTEPEVKFSKKAHAIPEFLGNKKFVLKSECDNCNEFFGKNLENNLSNYLGICRTILMLNGKNGIPEFKTKDKKERVKGIKNQELQGLIAIKQENKNFMQIDEQNKVLTFNTEREPYIPISVYKCLVKIALSLLPDSELKYFNQTIKWIRNKSNIDLVYYNKMINYTFLVERFVSSNKFINLRTRGYIRRNDKFKGAYFYFILEFLNMSFQISVPCLDKDVNFNINKNPIIIPSSYELEGIKYMNITVDIQDMRKIYKINSQQLSLSIGYSELEKNTKVDNRIWNLKDNLIKKIKKDLKINS